MFVNKKPARADWAPRRSHNLGRLLFMSSVAELFVTRGPVVKHCVWATSQQTVGNTYFPAEPADKPGLIGVNFNRLVGGRGRVFD